MDKIAINFFDSSLDEIEDFVASHGERPFRARQVFKWVYKKYELNLESMTDLSLSFREKAKTLFDFSLPEIADEKISKDGTRKYLLKVGERSQYLIESVIIPAPGRMTLCVSSEVGCNLGCTFCYTGKQKLKYRLRASEIVGQFYLLNKKLLEEGVTPISNIVFMGMGEPLDNDDAVFKAIDILKAPLGLALSRKKITVSTSGIVSKIPRVADSGVQLAVSLNASNDTTRSKIMPINKKWNIKSLVEACQEFYNQTKTPLTFEYVLLKGVTDSMSDVKRLRDIVLQVPSKVNLIPFNPHPGSDFQAPDESQVELFQQTLVSMGVLALRRKTMGQDILGACGQLTSTKPSSKS